jgi:hypothetical protein
MGRIGVLLGLAAVSGAVIVLSGLEVPGTVERLRGESGVQHGNRPSGKGGGGRFCNVRGRVTLPGGRT